MAVAEYVRLINSCTSLSEAESIHTRITGQEKNVFLCNKLIHMYAKCGSLKHARAVFDRIHNKDDYSYNIMLASYIHNGSLREAEILYRSIPDAGKNTVASNAVTNAYAHKGHLVQAQQVFNTVAVKDTFTWNAMLSAILQAGDIYQAEKFYEEIPVKDVVSQTAMITAYALSGHLSRAKQIFDTMPFRDLVSCTSMINAYSQSGDLKSAKAIFEQIPLPSLGLQNTMITVYAKNRHLQTSWEVFQSMPQWDMVSWNSILSAYALQGDMEQATKIFNTMPVKILVTWNTMITSFAKKGDLGHARFLFDRMPMRDVFTWNSMLSASAQNGEPADARECFETMPERNLVSWLTASAQMGDLADAEKTFREMPEHNLVSWNALFYIQVFTFRRGTYGATIYSLSFGPASLTPQLLAATSSRGTLHVYRLVENTRQGLSFSDILATVIPSDFVDPALHYAAVRHGLTPGVKSICAVAGPASEELCEKETAGESSSSPTTTGKERESARIFVAIFNGVFNEYHVSSDLRGEGICTLEREFSLLTPGSDQISARYV